MSEIVENELYEVDEATNAFVPVVALDAALQAGDRVTVQGNKLYKIDETTNALIPVVTFPEEENIAGFMVVPDYNNIETVNRLSGQGSSWTVDRAGFIKLDIRSVGSAGHPGAWLYHIINGKTVGTWGFGGSSSPALTWSSSNIAFQNVYPVSAGDVVTVSAYDNKDTYQGAFFVPPKFIKKELPVIVEKNGSYSLDEVKTADTWIDGKPIYKRTHTFQVATNSGTGATYNRTQYATLPDDVDDVTGINGTVVIDADGTGSAGVGMRLPVPYSMHVSGARSMHYSVVASPVTKRIDFVYWLSDTATDGSKTLTVRVQISYTKTTD